MSEMPRINSDKKLNRSEYDELWKLVLKITRKCEVIRRRPGASVEETEQAIDQLMVEWMTMLEASGKCPAVMDLLPTSPLRQTGDRLFLTDDGASFLVLEPRAFRIATGHLDADIQEPKRHTFFLPPNEAELMRSLLRQTDNATGIFGRSWHTTRPSYGMVPFQINAEAANIEIIMDEEEGSFSLHPTRHVDLERDADLFQDMLHICATGIAEVRVREVDTRQIAQAA